MTHILAVNLHRWDYSWLVSHSKSSVSDLRLLLHSWSPILGSNDIASSATSASKHAGIARVEENHDVNVAGHGGEWRENWISACGNFFSTLQLDFHVF